MCPLQPIRAALHRRRLEGFGFELHGHRPSSRVRAPPTFFLPLQASLHHFVNVIRKKNSCSDPFNTVTFSRENTCEILTFVVVMLMRCALIGCKKDRGGAGPADTRACKQICDEKTAKTESTFFIIRLNTFGLHQKRDLRAKDNTWKS